MQLITRKNTFSVFFGIFLVSMLFVPASMPTTEAQNSDYKKYTHTVHELVPDLFTIEYPDDWTIYHNDAEFPKQQSKYYNSLPRWIGFFDEPLWYTTVQVFEHPNVNPFDEGELGHELFQNLSWKWRWLNYIPGEFPDATDSAVLKSLVNIEEMLCEIETFEDGTRECYGNGFQSGTPSTTLDSYIFYTNDNKKVYIVKSAYSIAWWNLSQGGCNGPCSMISISGVIYGENSIWEIVAETKAIQMKPHIPYKQQHEDAIMHMIKSFSLEPKSEQPASEPVTAIPEWIKNNAGWWADGQIDDSSFLQGIQYLVKEGIIKVS